jgi:hypothetical protein
VDPPLWSTKQVAVGLEPDHAAAGQPRCAWIGSTAEASAAEILSEHMLYFVETANVGVGLR